MILRHCTESETMDNREQFEAWASENHGFNDIDFEWHQSRNCYASFGIHFAYKAWQASRAAIVVDIDWPEANDDTWKEGVEGAYAMGHEDGKDKVVIAVRQGLRAAGITVKGDSDGNQS